MVLIKIGQRMNLYFDSKEKYSEWKEALRTKVLVSDFHTEYKVTKLIGTGSFARVISITKIFFLIHFRFIMESEILLEKNSQSKLLANLIYAETAKEL